MLGVAPLLPAQMPTARVQPTASLRLRAEGWDWFDQGSEGRYGFGAAHLRLGLQQDHPRLGWQAELASPMLFGLPDDAVLPGAAGQAGLGATYFSANGGRAHVAGLFPKQLLLRLGPASGPGRTAVIGRFEFSDAGEWTPGDPVLAQVRRTRVAQRLIGPFGFTHGQRSFDGIQLHSRRAGGGATLAAFRPTAGVFDVDGARQLPVDVVYLALNRSQSRPQGASDARMFVLHYEDRRGTVPVDSRPLSARQSGPRGIGVTSVGGHWSLRRGRGDVLIWGLRQFGHWAGLRHAAGAFALETGWRETEFAGQPALRFGLHLSSGDADPRDTRHETFFQILPTPRPYALFPFHNLQNNEELFVSGDLRPRTNLTLRASAHRLRLRRGEDLWALGGGAADRNGFGYPGRPTLGAQALGSTYSVSVAWQRSPRLQVELFAAHATGGAVQATSYGSRQPANFVYLETTLRR